jgi:hypothetical protein
MQRFYSSMHGGRPELMQMSKKNKLNQRDDEIPLRSRETRPTGQNVFPGNSSSNHKGIVPLSALGNKGRRFKSSQPHINSCTIKK